MIWDFKQRLFVSQRQVSLRSVSDLANPAVRSQLQHHVDALHTFPGAGDDGEYAALFEAVFPAEQDRRTYISSKIEGAKPSYGHIALASYMKDGKCRLIWTTNFDHLNADACAKVFGTTGTLTVGSLDAPELVHEAIAESRWPVEVKLHGDFRSRRLKNTPLELREQDQRLRQLFTASCSRFGLIVVGYSGRDDSIMSTLMDALNQPSRFPSGLFWLIRQEDTLPPRVAELLQRAQAIGTETGLVRVTSFDELLRDLVRIAPPSDTSVIDEFGKTRRRWSAAPAPRGQRGWPVLRFNALPILDMPTLCRLVDCKIGGTGDVRSAVSAAGVDVLAVRARAGVLAFGGDSAVRSVFGPFAIDRFDLHTISMRRLGFESAERGLLRDALARALQRDRGLTVIRWGASHLLAPTNPNDAQWAHLKRSTRELHGTVPGCPDLRWREGIALRLEAASDRLWLVFEPQLVYEGVTSETKGAAADFSRRRTVKRYNRPLHDLIAFWAEHIAGGGTQLRALGVSDGVDAVFTLGRATAFSRRGGA